MGKNGNTLGWGDAVGGSIYVLFGFLRCGDIVVPSDSFFDKTSHLAVGDAHVNNTSNPQYLQVNMKALKTDQFHQGV